jgi:hypothetical protein
VTRWLAVLTALAVSLGLAGTLYFYLGYAEQRVSLGIGPVSGEVTHVREGSSSAAREGERLVPGDAIATGADGSAVLTRGDGVAIRLAHATEVKVGAIDDDVVELELVSGRVRARVRPDGGAVRMGSGGRKVLLTDADIVLAAGPDGTLSAQAERGQASVSGVAGVHTLREGERLHAFGDGASVVSPVPDELLLEVSWPPPTREAKLSVYGTTEPAAKVEVLSREDVAPVYADERGRFALQLTVPEGDSELVVAVTDAFGKRRVATGRLRRDTSGPAFRLDLEYER